MKSHDGLYELRVSYQFRLTFRLRADHVAELAAVGPHDVLDSPA